MPPRRKTDPNPALPAVPTIPATALDCGLQMLPQGTCRWHYRLSLFKDWSIFWLIVKIMGGICAGLWLFLMALTVFENGFKGAELRAVTELAGIGFAIMMVLTLAGYLLYALFMGGSYEMEFEMTATGITHRQQQKQFENYQKAAFLLTILSLFAKRPTAAGAGLTSCTRSTMHTDFAKVTAIRAEPSGNLIKLTAGLSHNRIYVPPAAFDFVLSFIRTHCPRVKSTATADKQEEKPDAR